MAKVFQAKPGATLNNRYMLVRCLGKGGMGEAWVALSMKDSGMDECAEVVIKLVKPEYREDKKYRAYFDRENAIAMLANDGSLVKTFETNVCEGVPYCVMEWVRGTTLNGLWSSKRWRGLANSKRDRIAAYCISHVTSALKYLHQLKDIDDNPLGIVHRDVCSSNILVSTSGHVKLGDFGVARSRYKYEMAHSGTGLIGKVAYMCTLHLKLRHYDPKADLFAAGAVLYELLEGKQFRGEFEAQEALLAAVARGYVPSLSEGHSPQLVDLYQKLTNLEFESSADVVNALENWDFPNMTPLGKIVCQITGEDPAATSGMRNFFKAHLPDSDSSVEECDDSLLATTAVPVSFLSPDRPPGKIRDSTNSKHPTPILATTVIPELVAPAQNPSQDEPDDEEERTTAVLNDEECVTLIPNAATTAEWPSSPSSSEDSASPALEREPDAPRSRMREKNATRPVVASLESPHARQAAAMTNEAIIQPRNRIFTERVEAAAEDVTPPHISTNARLETSHRPQHLHKTWSESTSPPHATAYDPRDNPLAPVSRVVPSAVETRPHEKRRRPGLVWGATISAVGLGSVVLVTALGGHSYFVPNTAQLYLPARRFMAGHGVADAAESATPKDDPDHRIESAAIVSRPVFQDSTSNTGTHAMGGRNFLVQGETSSSEMSSRGEVALSEASRSATSLVEGLSGGNNASAVEPREKKAAAPARAKEEEIPRSRRSEPRPLDARLTIYMRGFESIQVKVNERVVHMTADMMILIPSGSLQLAWRERGGQRWRRLHTPTIDKGQRAVALISPKKTWVKP